MGKLHAKYFFYITLFFFIIFINAADVPNDFPPEYSNCSCQWSEWMDSDDPEADDIDIETYSKLRSEGYQFCEKPVDIQCYDTTDSQLVKNSFSVSCDVNVGLSCSFFCSNYKIRVACCYCSPPSIGPSFLITSEQTDGCLAANNASQTDPASLSLLDSCELDDSSQKWSWISQSQIKSEILGQCIFVGDDSENSPILLADCDAADRKQEWTYDRITKSLSSGRGYLNSRNALYSELASNSRWMAKVDIGLLDLSMLKGWPCKTVPSEPADGTVSCNAGAYQGSVCQFECNDGYTFTTDQHHPVVCMKNQKYNGTSPSCSRITCQVLNSLPHGNIECSDEAYLNSVCQFSCDYGYDLVGERQSTCIGLNQWNYSPPTCKRIVCMPDLTSQSFEHGVVNCNDTSYLNSLCSYNCIAGYQLNGSPAALCGENGSWNTTSPSCQKVQCSNPPNLQHGSMNCSDKFNYQSTCSFACDIGYTLVGSATSTCMSDKTWGSELPVCERKVCTRLNSPDHGSLSCSDSNYFASDCTFQCSEGFRLSHNHPLLCTEEGWDQGAPLCEQITCSRVLAPNNLNLDCTNGELYGSKCKFTCDQYYSLEGSQVIACGNAGWNSTAPTCSKITCSPYKGPKNGAAQCYPGTFDVNSVCITSCNEGYALKPPNGGVITCSETGEWEGVFQQCEKIKCRSLSLLNGKVDCSDESNFNSMCHFTCNDGFNLYGSQDTVCSENGWSQQAPTCGQVLCLPQVAQPANGQIDCNTEGVLSCTFSCNRGFNLIGNNHTECQRNGRWSNREPPKCQRISCDSAAVSIANGNVECSNGEMFESVCNYTCNHGYLLSGEKLTTCSDNGLWNAPSPSCTRIFCPVLDSFRNGDVQCTDKNFFASVCTFTCLSGYSLIGSGTIECRFDQTWSETDAPYCEKIRCSYGFSNPSNGHVSCSDQNNHDSVCSFTCDYGFRLEGEAETKCGTAGWSVPSAPSCTKITCDVGLTPFNGGSESCDRSNNFGSVCSYTCNEGYELKGASQRECEENGDWSEERPSCDAIECPSISIEKAKVKCSAGLRFESECDIECLSGYQRKGSEKVTCTLSKTWNPSTFPVCEFISSVAPSVTPTLNTTATLTSTTSVATDPEVISPPQSVTTTPATQLPAVTDSGTGSEPVDGDFPIIPVVVGVAVLLVVVIIIIVCCVLKRRRKKPLSMRSVYRDRYDETQLQKLISNGSTSRKFAPIQVDRLESEFSRKHADDDKLFREEFSSLPEGRGSREQGGKIINKEKNRYTNIIPYDHSRVVLPRTNKDESDYINASFIDGYKHKGKFIAAQGPKSCTINDFWRMIWDQNVTTVIMVTNLNEGKEVQPKCAQYWPQPGKESYGDLEVCFTAENHLVDYTVRKFTIQEISNEGTLGMRRNLVQYHFTSWPDFGVPKSPSGMLKFLRKIKHGSPIGFGAIVVHCSAGVGRTGTFICLDAMLDMMSREEKIDIFGFVSQMRGQRSEMVQTEQQYIFIYQALLEHHLYGDTEVDVSELTSYIDELSKRMPGNITGMEHDFKKLTLIRIQKEQMRAGNHPANMRKNRVLLILPYDWNRVILPVKPGVEDSDYINASYVDGYRQKDAYIATQGPLAHTVEDFWRLVWETQSASIVMLTELVERGQAKCEQYWPDNDVMIYGDISVEHIGENELDNYTTRDFVLTSLVPDSDRKQVVRQFHYRSWPENGPPVSGYSMIALVEQVQKQQQTSGNHPIVVHCSAGAGRTGSFCALSTALEQVKAEGVLDMFQIVKCLRMQRPHMVQNLEQYEFCFRAVQEYVDSMDEYYNFK